MNETSLMGRVFFFWPKWLQNLTSRLCMARYWLIPQMKAFCILVTMVALKIQTGLKIYGFWPKNWKISGFSPFPVSAQACPSDFFASNESLFDKTTFERIKKVGRPGEHDEIDEMRISPCTKCMVAIFDRKILSS